jgi:hypothetical protein
MLNPQPVHPHHAEVSQRLNRNEQQSKNDERHPPNFFQGVTGGETRQRAERNLPQVRSQRIEKVGGCRLCRVLGGLGRGCGFGHGSSIPPSVSRLESKTGTRHESFRFYLVKCFRERGQSRSAKFVRPDRCGKIASVGAKLLSARGGTPVALGIISRKFIGDHEQARGVLDGVFGRSAALPSNLRSSDVARQTHEISDHG